MKKALLININSIIKHTRGSAAFPLVVDDWEFSKPNVIEFLKKWEEYEICLFGDFLFSHPNDKFDTFFRRIIEVAKLLSRECFDNNKNVRCFFSSLKQHSDKTQLQSTILQDIIKKEPIDLAQSVIVGDTRHDMIVSINSGVFSFASGDRFFHPNYNFPSEWIN